MMRKGDQNEYHFHLWSFFVPGHLMQNIQNNNNVKWPNNLKRNTRENDEANKEVLLCDPGITHRQPLLIVASSSASHKPVNDGGSVLMNVLSWCGTASPPICGCYKGENYPQIKIWCSWKTYICPIEKLQPEKTKKSNLLPQV